MGWDSFKYERSLRTIQPCASLNLEFTFAVTALVLAGGILASWLNSSDIEKGLRKHIEEERFYIADHIADLL